MSTTTQSPSIDSDAPFTSSASEHRRAAALAERLERGARSLIALAEEITDAEWQTRIPGDGRKVGVVVHHVASMYPLEIQLAQALAAGNPIAGVTWNDVHTLNAKHAADNDQVTRAAAIALLRSNSAMAAGAVRNFTEEQLDRAAPISLNADAPLTCQFFIEDHALRHSYHHLARIRTALGR
jgi:DinB superfamily